MEEEKRSIMQVKNKKQILIVSGALIVILLFIAIGFIVHNNKNITVLPDNSETEPIQEEQVLDNEESKLERDNNDAEQGVIDNVNDISEKARDDNLETQKNDDDSLNTVPATEQSMSVP